VGGRLAALVLLFLGQVHGREPGLEDLARINQALQGWLRLIDADRLHLVVDRQEGEVRLQHGRAVLRACPVLADSLGPCPAVLAELHLRVRRYRPSDPWSEIAAGPFDWEQNLALQATDACALYFTNRMLIYASREWERPRSPALQVAAGDLRALYGACVPGVPLVVLPPRWNEEIDDGEP
jgi:hypothetical protein